MKKILLASAILVFGLINAQTEKGSWIAGGSTAIGFNNSTTKYKTNGNSSDEPKVTSFAVTPSVGYFVVNNLAVGIDFGVNSETTKEREYHWGYSYDMKYKSNIFYLMPTVTYYFNTGKKLLPYLGAGIGLASIKSSFDLYEIESNYSLDNEFKKKGYAWKGKAGIIYLITPSIGIDLGVTFNQAFYDQDFPSYVYDAPRWGFVQNGTYQEKTTKNTFGVNAGFSFFFK